ncbi:SDR family oxidoreductase [Trinickia sp.]|uniref:SDR family oxidoreductase n=1 Tax=Trinickia sp. TaxID=2571163 RepID=UPI0039C8F041
MNFFKHAASNGRSAILRAGQFGSFGRCRDEGTRSGCRRSDREAHAASRTPLGRTGRPDDIRGVAVFVVSDDSQGMMGKQLMAAGRRR